MIIFVIGLPGSGKSYFAARLAQINDAVYLNSDRIRKELLNYTRYTDKEKNMVYEEMLRLGIDAALNKKPVVLDATFYTADLRDRFLTALQPLDECCFIEVIANEELIRERLKKPRIDSDANFEVYREIREQWQPLRDEHLILRSSDSNIENMLDQATEYLQNIPYDKNADR
jgi:predicted kinase